MTEAMIDVYGQVRAYQGCGRLPTRKPAQANRQYLQSIGHRDAHGRLLSTELRVSFGEPAAVLALLCQSRDYMERTHLTMRLYNLVRPLKTLRQRVTDPSGRRRQPRPPAMAPGLTDHIGTLREVLTTVVAPNN
jgi:hypothetical protein